MRWVVFWTVKGKSRVVRFLLSRPAVVVATVGLSLAGLAGDKDRPWPWIVGFALAIVVIEFFRWQRERGDPLASGDRRSIVLRRMLRLVSDLSELAGGVFQPWVVDLYLARSAGRWRHRRGEKVVLSREVSVALTDPRLVPGEYSVGDAPFGPAFAHARELLWWDVDVVARTAGRNSWEEFEGETNRALSEMYGVVSVCPLVDERGGGCRGLLVVHAGRDSVLATTAAGVLAEAKGARRLAEAREDIYRELMRRTR